MSRSKKKNNVTQYPRVKNKLTSFYPIFIQLYINSIFIIFIILLIIYIISIYINVGKQPFEYTECESETVCGIITEFSSYVFMLFSCLELTNF